jgi:ribosomal protein S18 acetylase RimI-like enzyme
MVIRPASRQDCRGIAAVHVSSWQDAYRGIVPQSFLDRLTVEKREQQWVELLERGDSWVLVADASGDIVGFVSFGNSRDDNALPKVGELYAIYVAPSHWSTGVGRMLWEAALEQLRELAFTRVTVWVLSGNQKAIRFYQRIGFALSSDSETTVEIGGEKLPEVRYEIAIA